MWAINETGSRLTLRKITWTYKLIRVNEIKLIIGNWWS